MSMHFIELIGKISHCKLIDVHRYGDDGSFRLEFEILELGRKVEVYADCEGEPFTFNASPTELLDAYGDYYYREIDGGS